MSFVTSTEGLLKSPMCLIPVQVLSTQESEQCTVHPAQPLWETAQPGTPHRQRWQCLWETGTRTPQGCSALLLLKAHRKRWRESSLRCTRQEAPSKDHIRALNERSGQSYELENPTLQVKDHKRIGFPSQSEAFNIHLNCTYSVSHYLITQLRFKIFRMSLGMVLALLWKPQLQNVTAFLNLKFATSSNEQCLHFISLFLKNNKTKRLWVCESVHFYLLNLPDSNTFFSRRWY